MIGVVLVVEAVELTLPIGISLDLNPFFDEPVEGPQSRLNGPSHGGNHDELGLLD